MNAPVPLRAHRAILVLLAGAYLVVALYQLTSPPVDVCMWRQTHTMSTAYRYYTDGIRLLHPQLDINGEKAQVIQEFPLYQALVAWGWRCFGESYAIPRLLNILFTLSAAFFLFLWTERYLKAGTGALAAGMFLLQPCNAFWSRSVLVDPFGLGLAIIAMYFFFVAWREPEHKRCNYCLATFLGVVAALIKPTLACVPLGFVLFMLLPEMVADLKQRQFRRLLAMFAAFAVIGVAAGSWLLYARLNSDPHEYIRAGMKWYLGTWTQRFDPGIWLVFAKRAMFNHLGILLLAGFFVLPAIRKYALLFTSCCALCLLYLFVLVNLNFFHTYYQLPLCLPIALMFAAIVGSMGTDWRFRNAVAISGLLLITCGAFFGSDSDKFRSPYSRNNEVYYRQVMQLKSLWKQKNLPADQIAVQTDSAYDPHSLLYFMHARGIVIAKNLRNDPSLLSGNYPRLYLEFGHHIPPIEPQLLAQWRLFYDGFVADGQNALPVRIYKRRPSQPLYVLNQTFRDKVISVHGPAGLSIDLDDVAEEGSMLCLRMDVEGDGSNISPKQNLSIVMRFQGPHSAESMIRELPLPSAFQTVECLVPIPYGAKKHLVIGAKSSVSFIVRNLTVQPADNPVN